MSLNKFKSLSLKSNPQNKSSFGERICDDLSEIILQYLPLEDKLRLECVSKQFQRTVFQKQYKIDVDYIKDISLRKRGFNLSSIESILKKCPKINSLVFKRYDCESLRDQIIDLILKYCNNLVETECDQQICDKLLPIIDCKSFRLKTRINFGPQFFPTITHIKELEVCGSLWIHNFIGLRNLKKVSLSLDSQEIHNFEIIVENNEKLKYLEIRYNGKDSNDINFLLTQISKLNHLIDLKIWIINGVNSKIGLNESQFIEGINKIGVNCQQLKSFGFDFNILWHFINRYSFPKINEFLSTFKSLKRLNIEFTDQNTYEMFSIEMFNGCQDITHLSLKFNSDRNNSANDTILLNIDKYLSNLQYLEILNAILPSFYLPKILSSLSKLETIKLHLINTIDCNIDRSVGIRSPIEDRIINNCKKVRILKIFKYLDTDSDSDSD